MLLIEPLTSFFCRAVYRTRRSLWLPVGINYLRRPVRRAKSLHLMPCMRWNGPFPKMPYLLHILCAAIFCACQDRKHFASENFSRQKQWSILITIKWILHFHVEWLNPTHNCSEPHLRCNQASNSIIIIRFSISPVRSNCCAAAVGPAWTNAKQMRIIGSMKKNCVIYQNG